MGKSLKWNQKVISRKKKKRAESKFKYYVRGEARRAVGWEAGGEGTGSGQGVNKGKGHSPGNPLFLSKQRTSKTK